MDRSTSEATPEAEEMSEAEALAKLCCNCDSIASLTLQPPTTQLRFDSLANASASEKPPLQICITSISSGSQPISPDSN